MQWAAALYWGLTTVTTVGFGDITPSTEGERITMIFVQFLGVMMFASVMGSITTQLQRMNRASEEMETFRSKLEVCAQTGRFNRRRARG